MANVNNTALANGIKTMYERRLLERSLPRLVHGKWARKASLNKYGSLEWRRYESLSAVTSPIGGEGSTPAENAAPTMTQVVADPSYYGAYLIFTDLVELEQYDNILSEFSDILGEQAGLSIDTIIRNALISGGTAAYTGGVSASASLDAPSTDITYKDLVKNVTSLMAANALPVSGGNFCLVIHPHTYASLMVDPTFVNLFTKETDSSALRSGKMGVLMQCEIWISSNAYEVADAGVGNDDVYGAILIGADAFGVAGMAGLEAKDVDMAGTEEYTMTGKTGIRPVEIIVKPVGSEGSADPMNQRGSMAWKVSNDTKILKADRIRVIYHTNMFSAD